MTEAAGTWPTNSAAVATFTNSRGEPGSLIFPVPHVTVRPQAHHPDAVCRDHAHDHGELPSNRYGEAWWNSPDIWVRNSRDGGYEPQNPIAGQENWVYVRIWNRGDAPADNLTVRVYNTRGGANLLWPDDWVPEIGATTISVAPGMYEIVSVPFTPYESGHFCFLVRIESASDPIAFEGFVPFENNICQRNVQILGPGTTTTGVGFGNRQRGSGYGSVTLRSRNFPTHSGTVTFTDPELFARWQAAGGTVRGGQIVRGTETIRIDVQPHSPGSDLGNVDLAIERLPFEAEELSSLSIEISGMPNADPPIVEVVQWVDGEAVGGNILRPAVVPWLAYLPRAYR
jgi:hypothetical protein